MATNRQFLFAAFLILFSSLTNIICAQDAGYFIQTERGTNRFVQRLVWTSENATRYEVIIEREVNGTYIDHLKQSVRAKFIDVSLPPGKYRFQVIPYSLLNSPGEASQWTYIDVLSALRPEDLSSSTPEYVRGRGREPDGYVIDIYGHNLVEGAEINVRGPTGAFIIPRILDSEDEDTIRLFIERSKVTPGRHEIIIKNPGGLEGSIGGVNLQRPKRERKEREKNEREVKEKKEKEKKEKKERVKKERKPRNYLINIGAAFMPEFTVYGHGFEADDGSQQQYFPFGVRIGILYPFKYDFYLGPEIAILWYDTSANNIQYMFAGNINIAMIKWLTNRKLGIGLKAGVAFVPVLEERIETGVLMGGSFHFNIFSNFLLEAGIDYYNLSDNVSTGNIRPWIGIGFLF